MRKRMGVTHATYSSKTTGAVGARKSEAAKTERHAALHASQRKGEGASGVGLKSAVGAPASPTAMEKADPTPSAPSLPLHVPTGCCRGKWIGIAG
eukprot:1073512-Pleurochrysis_carterae.AAC.1